jgi:hypothetical protein
MAQCGKDCTKDPECALDYFCESMNDGGAGGTSGDGGLVSTCPKVFDIGHACTRNAQCGSGACSDGVCCNINCDKCGSCNTPGSIGTCIPIPAGTDPEMECTDNASDPTGKCKGFCNGQARCTYPAAGTTCGQCMTCNGSGLCNLKPDDDATCGTIECDGLDDLPCKDYHDLTTRRCASLGACKQPNMVSTCTDVTNTCTGTGGSAGGAGGRGGSGGAAGTTGTGGSATGRGGTTGTAGSSPAGSAGATGTDGGTAGTGGGGGGCCAVGGNQAPNGIVALLLFASVMIRRRRRR